MVKSFSFASDSIRNADGSLNVEASCHAFAHALQAWEEATTAARTAVHAAIGKVLDAHARDGARIRTDRLLTAVLSTYPLEAWEEVESVFRECIADRSRYDVGLGRAGGVRRA